MAQVRTQIAWVLFLAILGVTLYQSIKYTLYYSSEPVATVSSTVTPDYENINQLLVCTTDWTTLDKMAQIPMEETAYFMGYNVNNEMASKSEEGSVFRRIESNETLRNLARDGLKSRFPSEMEKQFYNSLSILRGRKFEKGQLVTDTKTNKTKGHYIFTTFGCMSINPTHPHANEGVLINAENREGRLVDMPLYTFVTSKSNVFDMKKPSHNIYLSLYNPGGGEAFLGVKKHFMMYSYEREDEKKSQELEQITNKTSSNASAVIRVVEAMGGNATKAREKKFWLQKTVIGVDIKRYLYLNGRKHKCVQGHRKKRYPVGFRSRECHIYCEELAFREMYNCSTLSFFKMDKLYPKLKGDYKPCNIYDGNVPVFSGGREELKEAEDRLTSYKGKCIREEACESQTYCSEWAFKKRSISVEQIPLDERMVGDMDTDTETLHAVTFLLPDRMDLAEEQYLVDVETYLGTIGGILGIWMGASLLSGLMMLVDCVIERLGKKKKKLSKNEKMGE